MSDNVPARPAVPAVVRPAPATIPAVARPVPTATAPAAPVSKPAPAFTATKPAVVPAGSPATKPAGRSNGPAFSAKIQETPHGKKQFLFDLLDDCGANGVSDLHVHPGKGMWRLTSGKLVHLEDPDTDIITEETS